MKTAENSVLSRMLSTGEMLLAQIPECREVSDGFPDHLQNMNPGTEHMKQESFLVSF